MKKILIAAATAAVIGTAFLALSMDGQAASASSESAEQKYRFTQTIASSSSPGLGHEGHQIVRVLEPSDGIIYSGTLTYVTSEPVDIVVLHEIDPADSLGQAVWIIDDDTVYGWTLVDIDSKAGSFEYAGAGLLLHTGGDAFTATVTVEGSAQESQVPDLTPSLDPSS